MTESLSARMPCARDVTGSEREDGRSGQCLSKAFCGSNLWITNAHCMCVWDKRQSARTAARARSATAIVRCACVSACMRAKPEGWLYSHRIRAPFGSAGGFACLSQI